MDITPKKYKNILTKGLQSMLSSTPIEDGKLRFTEDTGNLFLDLVNGESKKRVKISDIIDDQTEAEIAEILAPLPKIYLASDTHRMYVFASGKWIDVSKINLTATTVEDKNKVVWFSSDDDGPLYDDTFYYNPAKKELGVDTATVKTMNIGEMTITTTETDTEIIVDFN